jgi:hypothetical protein
MKFFSKRGIGHHLNQKKFDRPIGFSTCLQKLIPKVEGVSIEIELFLNGEFDNRKVLPIVKLDHRDRKIQILQEYDLIESNYKIISNGSFLDTNELNISNISEGFVIYEKISI